MQLSEMSRLGLLRADSIEGRRHRRSTNSKTARSQHGIDEKSEDEKSEPDTNSATLVVDFESK
jgi:hypothetical protein